MKRKRNLLEYKQLSQRERDDIKDIYYDLYGKELYHMKYEKMRISEYVRFIEDLFKNNMSAIVRRYKAISRKEYKVKDFKGDKTFCHFEKALIYSWIDENFIHYTKQFVWRLGYDFSEQKW